MGATPSSANLEYYLGILDEKWKARKLIEMAGEATSKAYNSEGEEIDQTIDRLASWAVKVGMAAAQGERVIKEVLMGLAYQFDQERKGIFADVIPTGLTDYDRRFRGLVLQELCILAGRPSTGKTASALQVALNVLRAGTPVGIVSLEMTAESLLRRMAGAAAGLEMQSVQHFTDNQMVKLTAAMMRIRDMPLSIHDQAGLTVRQIQSIVRGWVQKNKVKVVIIDYLQLVVGSSKRGKDDRTLEVAEISLALKQLAKELNVAMLVLAQLNRDVERRGGRPRLSDLKESGAIEQDADQVIFLWYGKEEEEETKESLMKQIDQPNKNRPVITFTVAKKRNGATGDVSMIFEKNTQRFLPMTNDFSESYATHPQ
jgi:replicative DNA helicase